MKIPVELVVEMVSGTVGSICVLNPNWLAKRGMKSRMVKDVGRGLLLVVIFLFGVQFCLYLCFSN
jgi:hypothetical protein